MLRALELLGFKSFADKTRFEFPHGITVVVGPNGSGKSNIVDAIKWVLGEQSVKSLRGKEMADVIFNGSGTRRGMNSAEVTLTLDNSNHLLEIDTPEVHITRRVYRSGEGEYLINRAPARLRDIRDLLSGTGMGTQAYSVIEQGKVDVLLQSSPHERRLIFEEAAGISRFKARKLESLRRLDRVEQNLLRLSDIVDEVESRLRSVRLQAGKARRFKEHNDRLQELRTQVGLVDWRRLSDRLAEFEDQLQTLSDQRDATTAEAESSEARLLETDTRIGDSNEAIRGSEARIASNRERIAAAESTIDHERRRSRDLEREIERNRRRLLTMSARAGDLQQQLHDTSEEVEAAEEHHRQITVQLVEQERELTGVMAELDRIRGEHEQRRAAYMDQMRTAANLGNESSALKSQVAAAAATRDRAGKRRAELDHQLDALQNQLGQLRNRHDELRRLATEQEGLLEAAKAQLETCRGQYQAKQEDLAQLRQRQAGVAERASVLEELQRRQEGLGAGVKDVLAQARQAGESPFRNVHGLVADLLQVSVEIAPLVDLALGPKTQYVVALREDRLIDHLRENSHRLGGRVGFLWLDPPDTPDRKTDIDLTGQPGILGRADRFVKTDPQFAPLVRQLLGKTWFVEKLADALRSADTAGEPLNFVTLTGELLAADGTLAVGPRHTSAGLISRRSQLRALQEQLSELNASIGSAEQDVARVQQQIDQQQQQVKQRQTEYTQAVEDVADHRVRITALQERRTQLDRQQTVLRSEVDAAEAQHGEASRRLADAQAKREQIEQALADTEVRLAEVNERIDRLEAQRQVHNRETTETKVDLAKSEERLRNLHARMNQFEEGRQERQRAIADGHEQLAESVRREEAARWSILRAESEVAQLYLHKETFTTETVALINQREFLRQQRTQLTADAQKARSKVRRLEEKIHAKDLSANEIRHERSSLAGRLREDYAIELAELEHQPSDEEQHEREQVQQEIDQLRQKLNNLGNVNLEALEELESLDDRHQTLSAQYNDLVAAKDSLMRIIDKINTDSRRLFAETLETVTGHFRQLFRDLFGGGHGDIVLEEDVDILESGIEIVARPPGKEPRSISLLSGGEKTITCVALLLAIFRSRPSPFCVLDEVDAALDEANIDRFTQVLQGFLDCTQFIIVTHSKKTMACADTLYGVTMQESGVSKQVSVRFEDVSEDGRISEQRLAEAESQAATDDDDTQAA